MPNKSQSPVLKLARFMSEMSPEVKDTVMAIVNKQEDHPAVKTVAYFAGLKVEVARAILDIIITAVNQRDPDFKKPGRPPGKAKADGATAASPASPVAAGGNPPPAPKVAPATAASPVGKSRR